MQQSTSIVDTVFNHMLNRVRLGAWPSGRAIPSERRLMEEYGVSRIVIREAIARMRALGLLVVSHGRKSVVGKMDTRLLGRLFPLMLTLEGEQNFLHFLQMRMTIEMQAAFSAAINRTEDDLEVLGGLMDTLEALSPDDVHAVVRCDHQFHLAVAQACKNPLFPMLLEALSGYLAPCQAAAVRQGIDELAMTNHHHRQIANAIASRRPDQAKLGMEAHLRISAGQIVRDASWYHDREVLSAICRPDWELDVLSDILMPVEAAGE